MGNRQGGKGMNVLKDGSYRLVLWFVVVLGISSVALMPQHGKPVSTGPDFVDALCPALSTDRCQIPGSAGPPGRVGRRRVGRGRVRIPGGVRDRVTATITP